MSAKTEFIIGGSGTGKSTYLKERFADDAVKNPDKKYIMIVPEQAASTVERDMVKIMSLRHGRNGFMNIDIIGISRLAYKILDELREHMGTLMSDAGKSMLIRLVAGRTDLRVYKKSIDKEGFIAETKSLLSELFQYDITLDDIEKVLKELEKTGENTVLAEKLHDMAAIYQGFETHIEKDTENALPSEKMVAFLLGKLGGNSCSILDNAVIAFDGFTGYTPSQYSLIEELMKRAESLSFAITMDAEIIKSGREVRDYELFYLSYQTYVKLCRLSEKVSGIAAKDINITLLQENHRHGKGGMLYDLEKKLFRVPVKPYEGDYYKETLDYGVTLKGVPGESHSVENDPVNAEQNGITDETGYGSDKAGSRNYIRLWECYNPEEQLACIAQEIRRKIIEEGLRYRDIAVLAPNLNEMSGSFDKIFEMYDIPFFPDYTRELKKSPFTEAILSLLDCEENNYDYESMFSLLKTGVIDSVDQSEVSTLENHVLTKNIRGFRRWNRSFSYLKNNEDIYTAEEAARKKVMLTIAEVHGMMLGKGKTVSDRVMAIKYFMAENHFESKIEEAVRRFEQEDDLVIAAAYRPLFGKINEFLDKMVEMLGDERVSIREFAEIFKTGMSEIKIGTIPAALDSVIVGDIERTRVSDVKVIFLINANDGIIPKPGKPAKILSDRDKGSIEELFGRLGIKKELAPDEKKSLYIEQFYLYLCMAKPSQELIITKCSVSMAGEELEGSYILTRLGSIFPELKAERKKPECFKGTAKSDVYFFSEMVRKAIFDGGSEDMPETDAAILYSLFREKKLPVDKAAGYRKDNSSLTPEAVEAAMDRLMVQSVSKLESYAVCEYRFFLQYMLKLKERDGYAIDPLKFGNILHGALEKLFRDMDRKVPHDTYENWKNTSDAELSKKMRDMIDSQLRSGESGELLAADGTVLAEGRDRFIVNSIYELGERTVKMLSFHIRGGEMGPKYYEDQFNLRDKLESSTVEIGGKGNRLKLTGKIDRADIFEDGDNIYLRIIDYKTGNKDFSYGSLRDGRQLQLPMYLSVMIEKVKNYYKMAGREVNVIPVGMYYYPVIDPYVKRPEEDSDEVIEDSIRKELRLKGITTLDPMLQAMQEKKLADPDRKRTDPADIIPLDFYSRPTKDKAVGDPKGVHTALSPDEFSYVTGYTRLKAREMTEEMFRGDIQKNPVKSSNSVACNYCAFKDVCRFDSVNRDNKVKKILVNHDEEAYNEITTRGAAFLHECGKN